MDTKRRSKLFSALIGGLLGWTLTLVFISAFIFFERRITAHKVTHLGDPDFIHQEGNLVVTDTFLLSLLRDAREKVPSLAPWFRHAAQGETRVVVLGNMLDAKNAWGAARHFTCREYFSSSLCVVAIQVNLPLYKRTAEHAGLTLSDLRLDVLETLLHEIAHVEESLLKSQRGTACGDYPDFSKDEIIPCVEKKVRQYAREINASGPPVLDTIPVIEPYRRWYITREIDPGDSMGLAPALELAGFIASNEINETPVDTTALNALTWLARETGGEYAMTVLEKVRHETP